MVGPIHVPVGEQYASTDVPVLGAWQVKVWLPDTPRVAEILVVPVAKQGLRPAALIVAVEVTLLAQVTCDVKFCVDPSEYVPVAVNCVVPPLYCTGEEGVTAILESVGVGFWTVSVVVPLMLEQVA